MKCCGKTFIAFPIHTALLWFFRLTATHTIYLGKCKAFIIYIQQALNKKKQQQLKHKHIMTSFIFLTKHMSAWRNSTHWRT